MSHWKKFSSNVLENTNHDLLKKSLKEMGVTVDESIKMIRNSWGNEKVDAGLIYNSKNLSLGFNFNNEKGTELIELSGDFYSTGLDEATFMDKVSQVYQKNDIVNKLTEARWSLDESSISKTTKGEITMEFVQYC